MFYIGVYRCYTGLYMFYIGVYMFYIVFYMCVHVFICFIYILYFYSCFGDVPLDSLTINYYYYYTHISPDEVACPTRGPAVKALLDE